MNASEEHPWRALWLQWGSVSPEHPFSTDRVTDSLHRLTQSKRKVNIRLGEKGEAEVEVEEKAHSAEIMVVNDDNTQIGGAKFYLFTSRQLDYSLSIQFSSFKFSILSNSRIFRVTKVIS